MNGRANDDDSASIDIGGSSWPTCRSPTYGRAGKVRYDCVKGELPVDHADLEIELDRPAPRPELAADPNVRAAHATGLGTLIVAGERGSIDREPKAGLHVEQQLAGGAGDLLEQPEPPHLDIQTAVHVPADLPPRRVHPAGVRLGGVSNRAGAPKQDDADEQEQQETSRVSERL